ncbi:DUF3592 domain-containing protein [bacterium]|nr:DUF3592 domain-containing protein [bacterium]NUN44860.1 DUF3592 domain-containing protein [bacterium]
METYIFQFVSLTLLGIAYYLVRRKQNFIAECDQVEGTVVRFRESRRPGKNTTYAPVVEYFAYGKSYQHESSLYRSSPGFEIHQTVSVLYKRDKPEEAMIDSFLEKWFIPMMLGIVGSVFLIIGTVFPLLERKI